MKDDGNRLSLTRESHRFRAFTKDMESHRTRGAVRALRVAMSVEAEEPAMSGKGVPRDWSEEDGYDFSANNRSLEDLPREEDGEESDDEARQQRDPMFQALKRGVFGLASQRRSAAEGPENNRGISRRQRTSATVAAERRDDETQRKSKRARIVPAGASKRSRKRQPRAVTTTTRRTGKNAESQHEGTTREPFFEKSSPVLTQTTTTERSRSRPLGNRPGTRSRGAAETPSAAPMIPATTTTEARLKEPRPAALKKRLEPPPDNSILVHFVATKDCDLPPSRIVDCDPSQPPPSFKRLCVGLTDARTNQRIDLRKGVEVSLQCFVNGQREGETLKCARSYPGGLFYFTRVAYASFFSGTWTLTLNAKWQTSKRTRHQQFKQSTHVCTVRYEGDLPDSPARKMRRKSETPRRACTFEDLQAINHKDDRALRKDREWFLNEPQLLAGRTVVLADSNALLERFEALLRRDLAAMEQTDDNDIIENEEKNNSPRHNSIVAEEEQTTTSADHENNGTDVVAAAAEEGEKIIPTTDQRATTATF